MTEPKHRSTTAVDEQPPTIASGARRVAHLLLQDPELGDGLVGERLVAAERDARARVMVVRRGAWRQAEWPEGLRRGAGLLVLDGLLLRSVGLEGRFGAELLAAGDLLRPWQREDAVASLLRSSDWRALQTCRMALLDVEFLRRVAPYPEIAGQLVARALRRSRQFAVVMAIVQQTRIDTRLRMLFWHLADRWGIVRADSVIVPVKLTHGLLAELVAARRPTVSVALAALEREGAVVRTPEGWRLRGAPPGELEDVSMALNE